MEKPPPQPHLLSHNGRELYEAIAELLFKLPLIWFGIGLFTNFISWFFYGDWSPMPFRTVAGWVRIDGPQADPSTPFEHFQIWLLELPAFIPGPIFLLLLALLFVGFFGVLFSRHEAEVNRYETERAIEQRKREKDSEL